MSGFTDFLYSRPSFLEGLARAIDLGNTLNTYNVSSTDKQADQLAFSSDYLSIGEDWKASVEEIQSEYQELEKSLLAEARHILVEDARVK